MISYRLIFLLLLSAAAFGQQSSPKEFEGIIIYKTTIVPNDSSEDAKDLQYKFGSGHILYFKAGRFKWVSTDTSSERGWSAEYKLFNPFVAPSLLIKKIKGNDTLFISDEYNGGISRSPLITTLEERTVSGFKCSGTKMTYKGQFCKPSHVNISLYCADPFKFDATRLERMNYLRLNELAKNCGAVPLRVEFDSSWSSHIVVMEAIKVETMPIADSVFEVDAKAPMVGGFR
jgi:hypothetical protein